MSYILPPNTSPSKILYIDSRDATSYLATNSSGQNLSSYYQYILKENIEIPSNQRVLVSLNSATIPYSFYNIREGINDTLQLRAQNITTGTTIESGSGGFNPLVIPAGNYNVYSLAVIIMDYINDTFQSSPNVVYKLTMTYNTDRQKFLYKLEPLGNPLSAGQTIKLTFRFENFDLLSPHIEMGFPAQNIEITTDGATPAEIYSSNVVDINGSIHGVYVRSNLVQDGTLDSQNGTFSNILARIPINVQSGGIIFATPNNATHRSIIDTRAINILTIRLTDERNRILDLNGLDFQIAIAIDFIYAEKPVNVPMGGAGESEEGNSFAVVSDTTPAERIKQARIKALEEQKAEAEERRRRRVGRPRNVGRPKGSRNKPKIDEEEE